MTSSGPIHHSRFPAQQGQASPLARSAHSDDSLLSGPFYSGSLGQAVWTKQPGDGGPNTPGRYFPKGKRGPGGSHFYLKHRVYAQLTVSTCQSCHQHKCRRATPLLQTISKEVNHFSSCRKGELSPVFRDTSPSQRQQTREKQASPSAYPFPAFPINSSSASSPPAPA